MLKKKAIALISLPLVAFSATHDDVRVSNDLVAKSVYNYLFKHDKNQAVEQAKKACDMNNPLGCTALSYYYVKSMPKNYGYRTTAILANIVATQEKLCKMKDPVGCFFYATTVRGLMQDGMIYQVPKIRKSIDKAKLEYALECAGRTHNEKECEEKADGYGKALEYLTKFYDPEVAIKQSDEYIKLGCEYSKTWKWDTTLGNVSDEEKSAFNQFYDYFNRLKEKSYKQYCK